MTLYATRRDNEGKCWLVTYVDTYEKDGLIYTDEGNILSGESVCLLWKEKQQIIRDFFRSKVATVQ